jgi:hypothetical protein
LSRARTTSLEDTGGIPLPRTRFPRQEDDA